MTAISTDLLNRSMAYAETNFLSDAAKHLHVDKAFIRQNFDLNGKRILDFGSGMGGMSLWYAQNWDCTVRGVDIDGQHVAIAEHLRSKHNVRGVSFEKRDLVSDPITDEKFDVIFLNDVAEHIPYPILEKIFLEFYKVLSPNGRIFVSYPPWQGPYASHVTRVTHLPWCQYLPESVLLWWVSRKNMRISGEHESDLVEAYKGLNHLTHESLMKVAEKATFSVEKRVSHSILRKMPVLKQLSPTMFPLKFLISKELLILKK